MRIAKVVCGGHELAALECDGNLFRVDVLDRLFEMPFPPDIVARAATFTTRVFALGSAGLSQHTSELSEGFEAEQARLPLFPPPLLLPPVGDDPVVLELPAAGNGELALRVNGRALFGSTGVVLCPNPLGPLKVAPAVAAVLGDDLHLPDPEEAAAAITGYTLALAWVLPVEEREGIAQGVGPGPGRDLATHLGPFLTHASTLTGEPDLSLSLAVGPEAGVPYTFALDPGRLGRALARAARFGDLHAGDVLLLAGRPRLPVQVGQKVVLSGGFEFGSLEGRIGGPPGRRHRR